jgi:hypothetical protein
MQEHGDLSAAEPLLREQCAGRAAKLGPRHADTLEAVNNLALLLHQLRKLDEAEPFSKQVRGWRGGWGCELLVVREGNVEPFSKQAGAWGSCGERNADGCGA